MGNLCEPADYSFRLYKSECAEGRKSFGKQLKDIQELRHKIGAAKTKSPNGQEVKRLKGELVQKVKPIEALYKEKKKKCKKSKHAQSCGFVYSYDKYVKMVGPLDASGLKTGPVVSRKLAPLRSGYLLTTLTPAKKRREVFLDTGASITIFSKYYAELNDNKLDYTGGVVAHGLPLYTASGLTFRMGKIGFKPEYVTVSPLIDFLEGSRRKYRLISILGLDFLLGHNLEIDYDKSSIVFNQDVDKRLTEKKWSVVPFYLKSNEATYVMNIKVYLNGKPLELMFDTGGGFTYLIEQCLPKLLKVKVEDGGYALHTSGLQKKGVIKNVEVGLSPFLKTKMDYISVEYASSPNSKQLHSQGRCGVLGLDVLRRFNFMLDRESLSVYFSKRGRGYKASNQARMGYVPFRHKGKLIVERVLKGSSVEKAGIKRGDVILSVEGKNASSFSMMGLMDQAFHGKKSIEVVFESSGQKKTVVIQSK